MTGARTSGGACGLIRRYAKNLTWARTTSVVPFLKGKGIRKEPSRGAAWLSSARVVRCWVKSRNERNPCPVLPSFAGRDSQETAADNAEEGGDDVKSSWPLCPGLHTYYNGIDRGTQYSNVELIPKLCLSSDCGLKFAHMKLESLVIADQQAAVNTFPGLVHTARHTTKVSGNRSA